MNLPVLVINRDQDTDRLTRFSQSAAQYSTTFERVQAIDGHSEDSPFAGLSHLIGDHFWGETHAKPGAIGCFLSHRRAWARVAQIGVSAALICEDDAVFLRDPAGLEDLMTEVPQAEIMFANRRLANWAAATCDASYVALPSAIDVLSGSAGPKTQGLKPAPGGDCYLLTAGGAERLLEMTARQTIVCGVDWAMVWNSLGGVSELEASAFPELGILRRHLSPPERPLNSLILTDAIADQAGKGGSTIRHSITVEISDLRAQ